MTNRYWAASIVTKGSSHSLVQYGESVYRTLCENGGVAQPARLRSTVDVRTHVALPTWPSSRILDRGQTLLKRRVCFDVSGFRGSTQPGLGSGSLGRTGLFGLSALDWSQAERKSQNASLYADAAHFGNPAPLSLRGVDASTRHQDDAIEIGPFAAFFSCLSRRFSLVLLFGALTSFFGDFSPMVMRLLSGGVFSEPCPDFYRPLPSF